MALKRQMIWLQVICLFFLSGCNSAYYPPNPAGSSFSGQGTTDIQVSQNSDGSSLQISINGTDSSLQIDDSPQFNTPILNQEITSSTVVIPTLTNGLVPGNMYYARTLPSGAQAQIYLEGSKWTIPSVGQAYFRAAWLDIGVRWTPYCAGISYVPNTGNDSPENLNPRWTPIPWGNGPTPTVPPSSNPSYYAGFRAYDCEYMATGTIYAAGVMHDLVTLDEWAQFYNVYFKTRFSSLGNLRSIGQQNGWDTSSLVGPDSTMTIINVLPENGSYQIWECPLCNEQFIHGPSQLLRYMSRLLPSERTPAMIQFASTYEPIIVNDQLLRNEYGIRPTTSVIIQQKEPTLYAQPNWVAVWSYDATTTIVPPDPAWHSMTDNDLWLMAASAEILGANANDPSLVPLTSSQQSQLNQAIQAGVAFLKREAHLHSATDFAGNPVNSVSYFDGDGQNAAEEAYAGYTGQLFPTATQQSKVLTISWDISHYGRVPIMFRSLYDNLKAYSSSTNGFPTVNDIVLAVNQLLYVVMQPKSAALPGLPASPGPFSLMFNNYMDGSNGWYRVGYNNNPTEGYSPSQYCNSQTTAANPFCLTSAGQISAWGYLSAFQSDLQLVEAAFVNLAQAQDPASVAFKDRYYFYDNYHFSFVDSQGNPQHPPSLTEIINTSAPFVP